MGRKRKSSVVHEDENEAKTESNQNVKHAKKATVKHSTKRSSAQSNEDSTNPEEELNVTTLRGITAADLPRLKNMTHLISVSMDCKPDDPKLTADMWPPSLQRLHFREFQQDITSETFPPSLKELLLFGSMSNWKYPEDDKSQDEPHDLKPGCFPQLTSLTLDCYKLKQSIVKGVLPSTLKVFEYGCNQPLTPGSLPEGIEAITIGGYFDFPIACGVFPLSLRALQFYCYSYNQRIAPGVLNQGLEVLQLNELYDHPFEVGMFPASMKTLLMDCKYWDYPFKKGIFPTNSQLTELTMNTKFFNSCFASGALPVGLKILDLGCAYSYDQPFRKGALPAGLLTLRLGLSFKRKLTKNMFESCPNLETLDLSSCEEWNHPIGTGVLPSNLKSLCLPVSFANWLRGSVMPTTLEYLSLPRAALLRGVFSEDCKIFVDDDEIEQRDFGSELGARTILMFKDDKRDPMEIFEMAARRPRSR